LYKNLNDKELSSPLTRDYMEEGFSEADITFARLKIKDDNTKMSTKEFLAGQKLNNKFHQVDNQKALVESALRILVSTLT
jgi:hypothetical protein